MGLIVTSNYVTAWRASKQIYGLETQDLKNSVSEIFAPY